MVDIDDLTQAAHSAVQVSQEIIDIGLQQEVGYLVNRVEEKVGCLNGIDALQRL